jgi:alpha 1,3-glucosidase
MQDPFTLIVVLDGQGSGTGSLYLDDGRSFAYEKGSFSKSVISFKDGFLSNKVPPTTRLQETCQELVSFQA